ncbi:MAG TPA: STAS domain-containing protein [Pyrinomonadaceae bacterium]
MINLYINVRQVEDVTVLDLKGRERIRGVSLALHESIRCLAREGKNQVLLDLERVKYIDSCGLGELVSSHVTLDERGGSLKLMNLSDSVRELMTVTNLLTVFDVYDDEPTALAGFMGNKVFRSLEIVN